MKIFTYRKIVFFDLIQFLKTVCTIIYLNLFLEYIEYNLYVRTKSKLRINSNIFGLHFDFDII